MSQTMNFSAQLLADVMQGTWENFMPTLTIENLYTDSRLTLEKGLFIPLQGERFDGHDFINKALENGAVAIVCSLSHTQKYACPTLRVDDPLKAYQALAKFYRLSFKNLKVLGVTGSSGKTSTKEILRAVLNTLIGAEHLLATEGNTNNHIGVPQNIFRLNENHRFAILEMGTNHHGEIEPLSDMAQPHGAMITCIGASHLEHFGSPAQVAREKSTIFNHLLMPRIAVMPKVNEGQYFIDDATRNCRCLTFGMTSDCDMQVVYEKSTLFESFFKLVYQGKSYHAVLPIAGEHQAHNAAGAALLLTQFGFDLNEIIKAFAHVKLPGMRSKCVIREGVQWLNDAYNANPESMRAALHTLSEFVDPDQTLLVLGDMRELGDITASAHEQTILLAQQLMPTAQMVLVGLEMCRAFERLKPQNAVAFSSSLDAKVCVQAIAKNKKMVFLKASRGTQLELVE